MIINIMKLNRVLIIGSHILNMDPVPLIIKTADYINNNYYKWGEKPCSWSQPSLCNLTQIYLSYFCLLERLVFPTFPSLPCSWCVCNDISTDRLLWIGGKHCSCPINLSNDLISDNDSNAKLDNQENEHKNKENISTQNWTDRHKLQLMQTLIANTLHAE